MMSNAPLKPRLCRVPTHVPQVLDDPPLDKPSAGTPTQEIPADVIDLIRSYTGDE